MARLPSDLIGTGITSLGTLFPHGYALNVENHFLKRGKST
jgi:hypothetical protein